MIARELFESLIFRNENRGAHHGQSDMTLFAYNDGSYVGHIDYVVFRGEPSVQMIEVPEKARRNGYGTALIHELQSMFPETEIDMGMSTDSGAKLLASIPQDRIEDLDYKRMMARLKHIKTKEADWQQKADAMYEKGFSDADREWIKSVSDEWNDLHQEIWELEQELRSMKAAKRLFRK